MPIKIVGAEATHIRGFAIKTHRPEPCVWSAEERNALTELRIHPDIVTLKAGKSNITVVMNRNDYDNQIFKMLYMISRHISH